MAPLYSFEAAQSVLDNVRVKAKGIKSYDDLVNWLRDKDPQSLELGHKCLEALEATGNAFEEDWTMETWGTDPSRIDYHAGNLSKTSYNASFVSAWGAPEGIFREIARRYPRLTMRIAALEEGNNYSFLPTVEGGVVTEEQPEITDAFINEVEGPGETEFDENWKDHFTKGQRRSENSQCAIFGIGEMKRDLSVRSLVTPSISHRIKVSKC